MKLLDALLSKLGFHRIGEDARNIADELRDHPESFSYIAGGMLRATKGSYGRLGLTLWRDSGGAVKVKWWGQSTVTLNPRESRLINGWIGAWWGDGSNLPCAA